jgi:hypothetical protein
MESIANNKLTQTFILDQNFDFPTRNASPGSSKMTLKAPKQQQQQQQL